MHIVANSITRSSRNRRHLLALAGLILLFVTLCVYALLLDDVLLWDTQISLWIQTLRSPAVDQLMLAITLLADLPMSTVLIMGLVVVLLIERHWWLSCYLLCTFFSTTLSVTILKSLTQRPRPALTESTLTLMSFPSGHAARAVLIFGTLALLLSWGRPVQTRRVALVIAGILSVAVALSRVYLGVHWTSDVLAGAVLAAVLLVGIDWQLHVHENSAFQLPINRILAASILVYLTYCYFYLSSQALVYGLTP